MSQEQRAETGREIDVPVAVDVEDVRPFAALVDDRSLVLPADLLPSLSARIHRRRLDGGEPSR